MEKYYVKDVYMKIVGEYEKIHWDKYVWNRIYIPKHRFFVWLVMNNRL